MKTCPLEMTPTCWKWNNHIETVFYGVANILFVAGAIYMIYLNGSKGLELLKSVEFWGCLIPSSILTILFFKSLLLKEPITEK